MSQKTLDCSRNGTITILIVFLYILSNNLVISFKYHQSLVGLRKQRHSKALVLILSLHNILTKRKSIAKRSWTKKILYNATNQPVSIFYVILVDSFLDPADILSILRKCLDIPIFNYLTVYFCTILLYFERLISF